MKFLCTASKVLLLVLLAFTTFTSHAQKQQYTVACVAFYNLENLFDTIKSPNTDDSEFLPKGDYRWNSEKYEKKLHNMAYAIRQIGTTDNLMKSGPTILGVSEIENRGVLEDLIKTEPLTNMRYGIAYHPSPDARGVGVAFLYQQNRFKVLDSRSFILHIPDQPDFRTRNQLLVSGVLDGTDTLHLIVMYWPSRRGGEKRSKPLRNGAAALCRSIVDSLYNANPNAKIIAMGDLNDDPDNESLRKVLKARELPEDTEKGGLYNTMYSWFNSGIGSLAYDDSWNLFDQIIISQPLLGRDFSSYKFLRSKVFNAEFLKQKDGRYAGYPWRTFSGTTFIAGYSDHFPTYIYLVKSTNANDKQK